MYGTAVNGKSIFNWKDVFKRKCEDGLKRPALLKDNIKDEPVIIHYVGYKSYPYYLNIVKRLTGHKI